jgi:hypothetical protein
LFGKHFRKIFKLIWGKYFLKKGFYRRYFFAPFAIRGSFLEREIKINDWSSGKKITRKF